jgi:hypothetical protein
MPSLYGIIDQRDLVQPVAQITERNLAEAIGFYLNLWTDAMAEYTAEWSAETTEYQQRFYLPTSTGGMELSDEYARGLATRRPTPTYFDVAYPLVTWDDRKMWTQLYLAQAAGTDIDRDVDDTTARDRWTLFTEIRKAIMFKTNYTFNDDKYGALGVKRLLNGDGAVPPPIGTHTFDGTHNHYLGTNNATLTSAFLRDSVYQHLAEHGLRGRVVLEIAENLQDTVEAMTEFYPRSDQGDPNLILVGADVQSSARVQHPRAIGRIHNMEVRVDEFMPDNYGLATDVAAEPPIAARVDVQPELRGLRMVQDSPNDNYPLRNAFFQRRIGFGIRNRLNGVAFQVVASATYTDPTL